MMFFDGLPTYTVALPVVLLFGAYLVSKLLKLSFIGTMMGALLPLALPFVPLPLSEEFVATKPEYIIASGWLVLFCCALGWVLVRPVVRGAIAAVGVVKLVYFGVLAVALGVTGLLLADPALLQTYAPGWRGTMGIVLLCASVFSMSLALARVVKAAAFFAVWACVSLVLASEIFLGKLPHDVLRDDLDKIQALVPGSVVSGVLDELSEVSTSDDKLRAFVFSGSPSVAYQGGDRTLGAYLEKTLRGYGVQLEVDDLSRRDASIYELREIATSALEKGKPDLAVIVGWSSDVQRGRNSLGIPGLTEREARNKMQEINELQRLPIVAEVLGSRLYRFMAGGDETAESRPLAPRVPVHEYREQMQLLVKDLQGGGVKVVLVSEPAELLADEAQYRQALADIAREHNALFVNGRDILEAKDSTASFIARGRLLSDDGMRALATKMIRHLTETLAAEPEPSELGKALREAFPNPSVFGAEYQLAGMQGGGATLVVDPKQANGDLIFKVRQLDQGKRYYRVVFSVNGTFVADRRLDERVSSRVRFKIPEEFMALPLVELRVRTIASPGSDEDRIGNSEVHTPVPISVTAEGSQSTITVAERELITSASFSGSVLDPMSGEVIDTLLTDEVDIMNRWLASQPWGSIVVAAQRGGAPERLSAEALRYVGVTSSSAQASHPEVFVGVAGSKAQRSTVASGTDPSTVSIGSSATRSLTRFLLEDAFVESSGRSLLSRS